MKRTLLLASAFSLSLSQGEIQAKTWTKRFDLTQKQTNFQAAGIDFFFADMPKNQLVNGRDLDAIPGDTLPERISNELKQQKTNLDPFSFSIDDNFYQLTQTFDSFKSEFQGQLVAYHNRSDDIDVNLQVVLDGYDALKPNKTYLISAKLAYVSNAPAGRPGIGGAVDSNSFGLAVSQSPWQTEADDPADDFSMLRTFTLDEKGQKIFLGVPSGTCASTPSSLMSDDELFVCSRYSYMGRICNGLDEGKGDPAVDYSVWKANSMGTPKPLKFQSDSKGGPLYINLNSHSGFEGLSIYYIQGIEITVEEVNSDLL